MGRAHHSRNNVISPELRGVAISSGTCTQIMNCLGFERWMLPELQQMRAADTSVPELHQMFEHWRRHTMGDPRQLGFACFDVDWCSCEDKPVYLVRIPRGI